MIICLSEAGYYHLVIEALTGQRIIVVDKNNYNSEKEKWRIMNYSGNYFPMQNLEKILPNISSVEICPVISPR